METLHPNYPLIMGILNTTPDSFSDSHASPKEAIDKGLFLIKEGAHILDIGGESTKPGSKPLEAKEEWVRIEPVLSFFSKTKTPISIDTYHEATIDRCLSYPINYINNIKGLTEASLLKKIAKKNISYIAMHMHETPETMQVAPLTEKEILKKIESFFCSTYETLLSYGLKHEQIWLDPGICFGKDTGANLSILKRIPYFSRKYQLTLGLSRKSFFHSLLDIPNPPDRQNVSTIAEIFCILAGAKMIRTHDCKYLAKALKIFSFYEPDLDLEFQSQTG